MHLAVRCSFLSFGSISVCTYQCMSMVPQCLCLYLQQQQRLFAYQLVSCRTMNISSRSMTRRPVVRSIFSQRYGYTFHLCPVGDSCSPQQSHQAWSPMDPEILSILGYPGQSWVVPPCMESHGSTCLQRLLCLNFRHFCLHHA